MPTMNYTKENPNSIKDLFSNIAQNYDRTNAILSFQLHKRWNRKLAKCLAKYSPKSFLDLCCGTGEIFFTFLKNYPQDCEGYLLDFCPEMLECARLKAEKLPSPPKVAFITADACSIPLENNSIDCISIAYGIRNVKDPHRCFQEAYRVLKPGGTLGILELTQPETPFLKGIHRFYLKFILPTLGKIFTKDKKAYQYLCSSIQDFVKPAQILDLLSKEGFSNLQLISLNFGISFIVISQK